MDQCRGRTALVTGASRGIGKAIACRLAAEGAHVAVVASRLGKREGMAGSLEETVAEIESGGGKAVALACDLRADSERRDLVARAETSLGPLDILVNNAAMGVWTMPSSCSLDDRRAMLEVNFHAPVDLMQQALPGMCERKQGWILNIGSGAAFQPDLPYRDTPAAAHVIAPYGATKLILNRYTEGLAHELAGKGVRVNTLAPVAIVFTEEAARFIGHIAKANPDMVEPMEVMVEAAQALATGEHTGRVVYSRHFLHSITRRVRSLDGREVVGDAFMPANLEALT